MLFIIYAADLKAIGVTNHLSKYAEDTSLLVPEHCDVSLEQEFVHVCEWAGQIGLNEMFQKRRNSL